MKNYPKLCISLALEPQGVFIGTRGTGARGTTPDPKPGARRGHVVAACAVLRAARCLVYPLSAPVPGFWFAAPDFDRIGLLVNGYLNRPLITN